MVKVWLHCQTVSGFVISAATRKVLDFEIIYKVCQQCTHMKAKLNEAGFNDWYQDHICEGSYGRKTIFREKQSVREL